MQYVADQGYPVPAVSAVSDDGTEVTMQRVSGRSLMDQFGAEPWKLPTFARLLSELHDQLHAISAPAWLRASPGTVGTATLHLDLHPLNILMGAAGPVVIDWSNAARGAPSTDVALTWLLVATATIPARGAELLLLRTGRRLFLGRFLAHAADNEARHELAAVTAWKLADPHMSATEHAAMRALAARYSPRPPSE